MDNLRIVKLAGAFFLSRSLRKDARWKVASVDHGKPNLREAYDVIIPTKDNLEVLRHGIASLEGQQVKPTRYVFAVNGSSEYERELRNIAPVNSVFFKIPEPFNFSEAINRGVELTTSESILLFNDDVILKTLDATANLLHHLRGSNCFAVGAPLTSTSGKLNHFGIRLWRGWYGVNVSRYPKMRTDECLVVEGLTFALAMIRRNTLVSFRLDTSFPLGLNDVDFFIRLRGYGLSHLCTRIVAHHDESTTRGGLKNFPKSLFQSVGALLVLQEKWQSVVTAQKTDLPRENSVVDATTDTDNAI